MNIRIADEKDIEHHLLDLYIKGYHMHYENRKDLFFEKTDEELKEEFIDVLKNLEEIFLVIEIQDVIIGYVAFHYKYRVTKSVWIDQLIIDEHYQKQEYGTKLIMEVKKYAKQHHFKRIELNCWSFNEDAFKFYEKLGFVSQRVILEQKL